VVLSALSVPGWPPHDRDEPEVAGVSGSIEFGNGEIETFDRLADAWLPFFDMLAAADPQATFSPWYAGGVVDHLYPTCPALRGKGRVGRGAIDPEDPDVCGWCKRVWRARS
jgi:hypothetical protein